MADPPSVPNEGSGSRARARLLLAVGLVLLIAAAATLSVLIGGFSPERTVAYALVLEGVTFTIIVGLVGGVALVRRAHRVFGLQTWSLPLILGLLLLGVSVMPLAVLPAILYSKDRGDLVGPVVGDMASTLGLLAGILLIRKAGSSLGWTLRDVLRAIFTFDHD